MDTKHYRAIVTGRRNRAAGEHWEGMIAAACEYYSQQHKAEIEKTPEPMRPIRPLGNGQFVAHFKKKAQPDYKGTLAGGRAIVFEAKHTDGDRLQHSVVLAEQAQKLNNHMRLGAECFIIISFGFEKFFKVPWKVFRDMKNIYGRKYIKPEDIREYEIKYTGGVLQFL